MGGCNNADGGFSAGDDMRVLIRDFRSDERAVASTIGTVMALLVFLTFLSVIVNQYVPIWMKDSEASHMNTALGQFGGVKGDIDLQMLAAQASADAGTFHIPVTTATAINPGVVRVPIFSSPTPGTLEMSPDARAFTVDFDYMLQGVRKQATDHASGAIVLTASNQDYTSFPSNATVLLTHTSAYGLSWYRFFNQTLSDTLKLGGTYTKIGALSETFTAIAGGKTVYQVGWTLDPRTQIYTVRLTVNNNPGVMGISYFRLQHAQVQVGIGDATQQVQF